MDCRWCVLPIACLFIVTLSVTGYIASAQAAPITYDFDWQGGTGTVLAGWFTLNDGVAGPATVSDVSAFEVQLTDSQGRDAGPFPFPGSNFSLFTFDTTTRQLSAFRIDSIDGFISLNENPPPFQLSYFGNIPNGAGGGEEGPGILTAVPKPVPVPSTGMLLLIGLLVLTCYNWTRGRQEQTQVE